MISDGSHTHTSTSQNQHVVCLSICKTVVAYVSTVHRVMMHPTVDIYAVCMLRSFHAHRPWFESTVDQSESAPCVSRGIRYLAGVGEQLAGMYVGLKVEMELVEETYLGFNVALPEFPSSRGNPLEALLFRSTIYGRMPMVGESTHGYVSHLRSDGKVRRGRVPS